MACPAVRVVKSPDWVFCPRGRSIAACLIRVRHGRLGIRGGMDMRVVWRIFRAIVVRSALALADLATLRFELAGFRVRLTRC
jgi:hypothetical protein